MNKKLFMFIVFVLVSILLPKNVFAANNYENRHVCSKFEVAIANTDGSITSVSCHNTYNEAKTAMNNNSSDNVFILDESSTSKIIDAKYALVDLTVNGLTYFYESSSLTTRQYTGINTASTYGGVDAAFIQIDPSNYSAKVKIANFAGWIGKSNYEIVPLSWVKASSSYTVTDTQIKHNYITNVKTSGSSMGRVLGPKPDMLNVGTYYSYDGHYFYNDFAKMVSDYQNGGYGNAVNAGTPYYNYYQ